MRREQSMEGRPSLPWVRFAVILGLLALGVAVGTTACGSSEPGASCVGGVLINGVCEGKCVSAACLHDDAGAWANTCVQNRCQLVCDSQHDCFTDGTQDCKEAVLASTDDTKGPVAVCQTNGKQRGYGAGCPIGNECDPIVACPNGAPCGPAQCGGDIKQCKLDAVACRGIEDCKLARCANDGSPCSLEPACPDNECQPLTCLSAGQGDADAYCTRDDCKEDTDCAGGYYCAIRRDLHEICNSNPLKPAQDGLKPCIDPATFTTDGKTYQEGPITLLRNTCRKRAQCAPCTTDLDCSAIDDQKCVALEKGGNACARSCKADGDCDDDYKCTSGSCVPRFGACKGTGGFCEPCANDLDCGGTANNQMICGSLSGNQRACIDNSLPKTCATSTDCPLSPGGKHGYCLDDAVGVPSSSPAYHHCYYPFNSVTSKFGCW